jgi:elongator complex protein 3
LSKQASRMIIESLMQMDKPTREDLNKIKVKVAAQENLGYVLPNSQLIKHLHPIERRKLLPVLKRKTTRTLSGVAIIAAMTRPHQCPHNGPCAYCPGGPSQRVPQSYTGHEPAAMRGIQNQYDPNKQVTSRMAQLKAIGHEVDKVELIVMGGTFPSTPKEYQEDFVKGLLDALIGIKTSNLKEAKKLAETSKIHNVGITVETRPDWAKQKHIDQMLTLGVTRVELGVQNLYDDIYDLVERGHTVQDVVEATQSLKNSGLKVVYHLMPGLPGSTFERDIEGFKQVFSNSNYKPDMIKIYPCLVMKDTKVHGWWKSGKYSPYSTQEAVNLIVEVKKLIPHWTRIMRVQRDIPANLVQAGVKKSNLRQLVLQKLKQEGLRCRCIRCREVGYRWLNDQVKPDPENIQITVTTEEASEGSDVFVSAEDPYNDVLIGYLRLRIPSKKARRKELTAQPSSIIRELHICGSLVPVGKQLSGAWQHKGYGDRLLKEAERISIEEYNLQKILVISALGTKRYYTRFGYKYDGPYMSKMLE